MRPIIGITCTTGQLSPQEVSSLRVPRVREVGFRTYVNAVVSSGGAPFFIPLIQDSSVLESLVSRLDGLLLSGGPDINPIYFQSEPHAKLGVIDSDKDSLELQIAKLALDADLPILGICRGIQLLNVVGGGTLYQDIPSEVTVPTLKHRQDAPMTTLTHSVNLEQGTKLQEILQQKQLHVNSHHHQSVKEIAPGFRLTATAPDGIIEGIEHTSKPFVVGVQWHPEGSYPGDTNAQNVFKAFIQAAQKS